jgi:hypothetical protein
MAAVLSSEIKTVGKSGQISLGKSFEGKILRLDRRDDGTVLLTAVALVPESQLWTLAEPDRSAIAEGMAWAARTPAAESDLEALIARSADRPQAAPKGRRARRR